MYGRSRQLCRLENIVALSLLNLFHSDRVMVHERQQRLIVVVGHALVHHSMSVVYGKCARAES